MKSTASFLAHALSLLLVLASSALAGGWISKQVTVSYTGNNLDWSERAYLALGGPNGEFSQRPSHLEITNHNPNYSCEVSGVAIGGTVTVSKAIGGKSTVKRVYLAIYRATGDPVQRITVTLKYWSDGGTAGGGGTSGGSGVSGYLGGNRVVWVPDTSNLNPNGGTTTGARVIPSSGFSTSSGAPGNFPAVTNPTLIEPRSGSKLVATDTSFIWTTAQGVSGYYFTLGTRDGANDIADSGALAANINGVTVAGLARDGRSLFATLYANYNGTWNPVSNGFYIAPTGPEPLARLISPATNSTLNSSTVVLRWSPGVSATQYRLTFGSTRGSVDLGDSGNLGPDVTSVTASGLPTDGRALYVRLFTRVDGMWQSNDSVFTTYLAAAKAQMRSPATTVAVAGTSVLFSWAPAQNAQGYHVYVGRTLGSADIANSNSLSAGTLSWMGRGLPHDGSKFFVRLWSRSGGVWSFTDYAYTAFRAGPKAELQEIGQIVRTGSATTTLRWSPGAGAGGYVLWFGTATGRDDLAATDIYAPSIRQADIHNIPGHLTVLHVRLWTYVNGAWQFNDYALKTDGIPAFSAL